MSKFSTNCRHLTRAGSAASFKGTHAVLNCNKLKFFKINFSIPKNPAIKPTSFGKYLKKLRIERQLSQTQLARPSKVSHDSIRNWQGDRFFPRKASLIKLADFFQIDKASPTHYLDIGYLITKFRRKMGEIVNKHGGISCYGFNDQYLAVFGALESEEASHPEFRPGFLIDNHLLNNYLIYHHLFSIFKNQREV